MLLKDSDYRQADAGLVGWQAPGNAAESSQSTPLKLILQWKWRILAFSCLASLCAGAVIWHLTPLYSAESSVMIDVREMQGINPGGLRSTPLLDESLVRSDMEAFSSLGLARTVVADLGLNKMPEFCDVPGARAALPGSCAVPVDTAAKKLLAAVAATNDGQSYIIRIQATAGSATLAASIANSYANAFIAQRQNARTEVAQKATTWLTSYVERLRQQSLAADAATAEYRNDHHLIALRGETAASQSMSALNGELALLASETAQKQSVNDQVESMLRGGGDVAAVAPLLNSPLITSSLDREAVLANNEADLRTQFGSAHPQVVAAAARAAQMRQQIRGEVAKAADGLKREVAALNQRKAILTAQMTNAQNSVGQQGTDDVGLQGLESNAVSARSVYQSGLTRLREIEAEQGMAQSDAVLTSEAIPPDQPSYPHKTVMLAGAVLGSLGLGTVLAFAFGLISGGFRDAEHLEGATGLRMLGVFPRPLAGEQPEDMALGTPLSVQGESLRSILVNLMSAVPAQQQGLGSVVLITSAVPGEGKTSFALALGRSAMRSAFSTVLLDCDLRKPSVEALLGAVDCPDVNAGARFGAGNQPPIEVMVDRPTGLGIIALKIQNAVSPMLSAIAVRGLLHELRQKYDLIILDLPPVLAVADALTLSHVVDGIVLVVDARRTPRGAFSDAVQMLLRSGACIAGTVFSKGDLPKYAKVYGGYGELSHDLPLKRVASVGR